MTMTAMGFEPVPLSQRIPRRPKHFFTIKHRPWQIQPFMIAPVLAGETLQNLLLQSRCVTDPVKNPLAGWWCEYFVWYVKLRDIEYMGNTLFYPDVEKMLLDPTWAFETSNLYSTAARTWSYKAGYSIDWVQKCLERCVETYFRLDGELPNAGLVGSQWSCSLWEDEIQNQGANWMNSATDSTTITYDTGFNVDLNADLTITTAEIDQAMRLWEWQRAAGTMTLSFQEYLRQFGIKTPTEDLHRPELLRFIREWQYPSNTIDPVTGAPVSAISWSIAERADKDRFFTEPGFIFGASIARPKVYYAKQTDAAVMMLRNSFAWMPQVLNDDPASSWKEFVTSATDHRRGPLGAATTNGYWVDIKDLYLYGDQFTNIDPMTASPIVGMPTASLNKRYAQDSDADALFKTPATLNFIKQDGVASMTILGTQWESSPLEQRYT